MKKNVYDEFSRAKARGEKQFAVLIDPDNLQKDHLQRLVPMAMQAGVDYFFIGGSLIIHDRLQMCLAYLKQTCPIPTILFPGSTYQLSDEADAILFLSLISGRNPELLIGKHVTAAPYLRRSRLEVIPTGYMLIDGGVSTTAAYMSNSTPIPQSKTEIAVCTAMAGEMLGLKCLYLDAGSGAEIPVSKDMIEAVSKATSVPLIVGGGITTPAKAKENADAGADILVVGNAVEKQPELIREMVGAVKNSPIRTYV